jgi:hypothetical protein
MKKAILVCLVLIAILTGCSSSNYKNKSESNPNYYIDYLTDLGYEDIVMVEDLVSRELMNYTYDLYGYNTNTSSDFIYYYICYDQEGFKYNAFMPDKDGEENVVFKDFMLDQTTLNEVVAVYNDTTNGRTLSIGGSEVETLDIIVDYESVEYVFVEKLYSYRSVDGDEITFDEDAMKKIITDNLYAPIVYEIGKYYVYGSNTVNTVYLGKGLDDSYVFLLEDFQKGTLEVLFVD